MKIQDIIPLSSDFHSLTWEDIKEEYEIERYGPPTKLQDILKEYFDYSDNNSELRFKYNIIKKNINWRNMMFEFSYNPIFENMTISEKLNYFCSIIECKPIKSITQ